MHLHLTLAERLFIHRSRLDHSVEHAARWFSVPIALYKQWEQGTEVMPESVAIRAKKTTGLKPHEKCRVLRRRHPHIRQVDIASDLGVCRNWVGRMERGEVPCDKLEGFWERVAKNQVSGKVPSRRSLASNSN